MAKNTTWEEVSNVLNNEDNSFTHKGVKYLKPEVVAQLESILKPKSKGGVSTNPAKIVDGVTMHYCRFHERYEAECDMVMSQGKTKGYCKASISKWNKTNSQIKRLEAQAVGEMTRDNFDKARELANEAKILGEGLNTPSNYDYESDWKLFNGQVDEIQA